MCVSLNKTLFPSLFYSNLISNALERRGGGGGGGGVNYLRAHIHLRSRHAYHETNDWQPSLGYRGGTHEDIYIIDVHSCRASVGSIACPPLKRSVVGSILLSGPSCSLGYFPFQPVVHNWFIKGRGMYCSVYGKVHIKDHLLLIEKSSLCGGSGFPSKKCVNVTIWMTSNNRW